MTTAPHSDPRPAQYFTPDEPTNPTQGAADPRPAETFDPAATTRELVADTPAEASAEAALVSSLAHPRKRRWGLLIVVGGTLSLGALEAGQNLYTASLGGDWLSGAWGALLLVALGMGGSVLIRELWQLKRLRRHSRLRESLTGLDASSPGEARRLAERLRQELGLNEDHPHWQGFVRAHQPHHDGRDTRILLAHHLLAPRDREALRLISRMSGDTAILVAVSSQPLFDMLLVTWSNLVLIKRLARIYGLELGFASRVQLFRWVLYNLVFAGASELAVEATTEMLSMSVVGRLSARAGQGLGMGLFSARLGLRTTRLTRPLAFAEDETPRMANVRQELWQRLHRLEQDDKPP